MEIPNKAMAIPNELLCDGRVLRTDMINPALVSNYMRIKEKGLLIVEQPDDFLREKYSCTA